MSFRQVSIETVPVGVMVYSKSGWPLGVVCEIGECQGDRPARFHRALDNGRAKFQYVRRRLYAEAARDLVCVKAAS
jgi:hypothetical protein